MDTKGRGSSFGIATRYGLDGFESRWGRDLLHPSRPALGPTQPPIKWVSGSFLGVKWPRRDVDHPLLEPMLKKEYSYNLLPYGPSWSAVGETLPFLLLPFMGGYNTYRQTINLTFTYVIHIYVCVCV